MAEEGQHLPAAWYTKPEPFSRERRKIFAETWLLLGRRAQLARPGDYLAVSIAGWPVLALADAGGAAHAFRNVCRHQGLPIFDSGAGHCDRLRCRYHGWTYDFAGRFLDAPPASAPADPADPGHGLERIALAEGQGLMFVYLGRGDAPPLAATAGLDLAPAGLRFQAEPATDMMANWKLAVERYLALPAPAGVERFWRWPNLIVETSAAGVTLIALVPRAFQRSLAVRYLFADAALDAPALAALAECDAERAQAVKAGAEADHAALAAGACIAWAASATLEDFRRRLRAVHDAAL